MTIALPGAPFPVTYRELWLPPGINNNATLPTSVEGGHELALTGAQKKTTCDGVRGDGSATSNIVTAADAVLNDKAKYWVFLRFKFDVTFTTGSGDQYICTKRKAADDYIDIWFATADGKLYFRMGNRAGGIQFTLTSTTTSWTGGTWYTVLCSLSDTGPAQRLLVNGVAEDTDTVAAINTPDGGDLVILSSADGNADGFEGVVSWSVIGTDNLTGDEETDLDKGIPPVNAVNMYLYDEGRGVIAYDRGSGADNGVIDTGVTWKWGQVQQPVLSFDAINDFGLAAPVSLLGDYTIVYVIKQKFRCDGNLGGVYFFEIVDLVNPGNYTYVAYNAGTNNLRLGANGQDAGVQNIYTDWANDIDDYLIMIVVKKDNLFYLYLQGALVGNTTVAIAAQTPTCTAYIEEYHTGTAFGNSKTLLMNQIDRAFTQKQELTYSRYIRNIFNLPISI